MPSRSDSDRLRALIEASGLSAVRFARDVLGRDDRTVRRWLAGDPMPDAVRDWLSRLERLDVSPARVSLDVRRP